jgi:hypothetical protein
MQDRHPHYPDISDILAKRATARKRRATFSFAEKLAILDAIKEGIKPIVEARKIRIAREKGHPS